MAINNWFKKQMISLSLAMSGIEKNALGQNGGNLETNVAQEQKHTKGTLADSLINGVITKEVESLRWRTYKVMQAAEGFKATITGYEPDETPIIEVKPYDNKATLGFISLDSFDDGYPLEMVIKNDPITLSVKEGMAASMKMNDKPIINFDKDGVAESATHGEFSNTELSSVTKNELPIQIGRESLPKFEIETYTTKLNVRIINETERLLEFYVSMYPNEDNRTTRLFIADVKKAIENPRHSTILDITNVGFITYHNIGVNDFMEYQYDIKRFDKIIEYNGHYVIKFIAEVVVNGRYILEQHRVKELDDKYENKERKKQ
jgi:hypothetical protein